MSERYDFLMYERGGVVLLDPLGTFLAFMLVIAIGLGVANSRLPRRLKQLVYFALVFRVVGAIARYVVLFRVYGGSGDARIYYRRSLEYAEALWNLNPAPLFDSSNWWGGKWWGTQFVYFPTSLIHTFLGASMPGGYIVFSLIAFAGLGGFVLAFRRTYPEISADRYARWIWFFPALWFWPSSIGKEAIVLFGLGLTIAGYAGRNGRIRWMLLLVGIFFVFGIRPQVAAVVIFSLLFAHWLSLITERWTFRNTVQAIVLVGAGLVGIYVSLSHAGVESFDVEGVQSYMESDGGRSVGGGSEIDAVHVGLAGIPFALINILFRPFPWEATSLMQLISCFEIIALWSFALMRRKNVVLALRGWRHDRLLRVAIPFILLYSVSLGMVIANLGIVARQRIFIFPFIFILFEAVPRLARNRRFPAVTRLPTYHPPLPASGRPVVVHARSRQ